ncbi:MAG: 2-hydroxyacid dehydrogenase [Alphaproteobacteria bacterium]
MKVAFVGSFGARLADSVREKLSLPCELIVSEQETLAGNLADVDVLVTMAFTRDMAEAAPGLRLVQAPGAGLDRIDRGAIPPGVHLANVHGHETGIAEYIMGAMIALSRSFGRLDAALRRGVWQSQWAVGQEAPPLWPDLAGKTLGILGFGHIGQALARRAAAFDMRITAIRREVPPETPPGLAFLGGLEQLDRVLEEADYLAVTLPLSPSTEGLIDARRLALMKPGACLINVARAAIVDETALFEALSSGRLAGAALDVWYRYPADAGETRPSTLPFHELDNVLMTPHVSGWTESMLQARAALIAGNIERIARGEPPRNAVDPTS